MEIYLYNIWLDVMMSTYKANSLSAGKNTMARLVQFLWERSV
jgi:hypothetical protein